MFLRLLRQLFKGSLEVETVYVSPNYKTKKALKAAVEAGETVTIFQPGPFAGSEPSRGDVAVKGPHYFRPHTWHATVTLASGRVTKVQ